MTDALAAGGTALADQHGGTWGEHPDHPLSDWRYQVENDETRLGYWEWVVSEIDARG
ncbi:hypothetical protein [Ottowia sp.]|uniref:hypothetical protein n=1 Tax=Ottowia sp. TaxID=1898956 RepID=UPI0025E0567D|nr:hypothetical protein [Ottowia sp.]MBK6616367.1 hypothetical protein [Ottowia sp.]